MLLIICGVLRCNMPTLGGVSLSQVNSTLVNSPTGWFRTIVSEGKCIFLFECTQHEKQSLGHFTEICIFLVTIVSLLFKYLTGFLADFYILMHVLTLWTTVKSFIVQLKAYYEQSELFASKQINDKGSTLVDNKRPNRYDVILKQYESLRLLSYLINCSLGGCILPYLGEMMFSAAGYMNHGLLTASNPLVKYLSATFYALAIASLVLSSEICRLVSS